MEFNYFYETVINASISIEDIGNCAIEANSDLGQSFYIMIKTNLGTSTIVTYGPIVHDIDLLPKVVNCKFERIEYNEGRLRKIIQTFLNNPYYKITNAIEIDYNNALNKCINILDYVKNKDNY